MSWSALKNILAFACPNKQKLLNVYSPFQISLCFKRGFKKMYFSPFQINLCFKKKLFQKCIFSIQFLLDNNDKL